MGGNFFKGFVFDNEFYYGSDSHVFPYPILQQLQVVRLQKLPQICTLPVLLYFHIPLGLKSFTQPEARKRRKKVKRKKRKEFIKFGSFVCVHVCLRMCSCVFAYVFMRLFVCVFMRVCMCESASVSTCLCVCVVLVNLIICLIWIYLCIFHWQDTIFAKLHFSFTFIYSLQKTFFNKN